MAKRVGKEPNPNKPIVYLPGVFDLFHRGHLEFIRKGRKVAEEKGLELVVGVQDDQSVNDQKGKNPICTVENRMEIVSEIKGVSRVLKYSNTYQAALLQNENVKVFIVSEDYGTKDIDQKDTLDAAKSLKIELVRVPYYQGISSSFLREHFPCE